MVRRTDTPLRAICARRADEGVGAPVSLAGLVSEPTRRTVGARQAREPLGAAVWRHAGGTGGRRGAAEADVGPGWPIAQEVCTAVGGHAARRPTLRRRRLAGRRASRADAGETLGAVFRRDTWGALQPRGGAEPAGCQGLVADQVVGPARLRELVRSDAGSPLLPGVHAITEAARAPIVAGVASPSLVSPVARHGLGARSQAGRSGAPAGVPKGAVAGCRRPQCRGAMTATDGVGARHSSLCYGASNHVLWSHRLRIADARPGRAQVASPAPTTRLPPPDGPDASSGRTCPPRDHLGRPHSRSHTPPRDTPTSTPSPTWDGASYMPGSSSRRRS